jgi:N-methylhydantoinase A/oxoprolinase/acetone carboxylase beta subunit
VPSRKRPSLAAAQSGKRICRIAGARREIPVFQRELLTDGHGFAGPALIDSSASTVFVPEAFSARVDAAGNLSLVQGEAAEAAPELAEAEGTAA